MRRQGWRSLGEFAADELPRPGAPPRVGERLGPDRRSAQFFDLHAEERIEVEAQHPKTRRMGRVRFGDYAAIDTHTNELIRSDWSSFSRARVRFTDPPATAQRRRLFGALVHG